MAILYLQCFLHQCDMKYIDLSHSDPDNNRHSHSVILPMIHCPTEFPVNTPYHGIYQYHNIE